MGGGDNSVQLHDMVLFLLGINVGLRAGDEHYNLRSDRPELPSQLQFKRNDKGIRCFIYTEDNATKTNDGGLKSKRNELKVVWMYLAEDVTCYPIIIVDKYTSLLLPVRPSKKSNVYLWSLESFTPAQWYKEQVVGLNTLRQIMSS